MISRKHIFLALSFGCLFFLRIQGTAFSIGTQESLIQNGGFESGSVFPEGWNVPSGNSVRFIYADPVHNRVLELNTLDFPTTDIVSYDTPFIDIDNGRDFMLEADVKTLHADLGVMIVGYGDVLGERKSVYRAMTIITADEGSWRRFQRRFRPVCRNFKVKSFQITFSSSGSPGRIFIDNVKLFPIEDAPLESLEEATKQDETETKSPFA